MSKKNELTKEDMMKILQLVMQAKEEAGQKVENATIMMPDGENIYIDNSQSKDKDKELPN
jgi:hypothetical protein